MMDINDYQNDANRTGRHDWNTDKRLTMAALGLNGEAGEVADIVKKVIYHEHDLHEEKLILELGDVLWYLSDIATTLGVTLEYIAMKNIEKRQMRYPDGFDVKRSREREA